MVLMGETTVQPIWTKENLKSEGAVIIQIRRHVSLQKDECIYFMLMN
jgi:hypothetical protein